MSNTTLVTEIPPISENHIILERKQKLAQLRQQGVAFPNSFKPNTTANDIQTTYASHDKESLTKQTTELIIAGRIMLKRIMGKAAFITIQDNGTDIQIYCNSGKIGIKEYEEFKTFDIGDIIGAKGYLFRTGTNELTLNATNINLLSKSLRPLPEKFHGLTDQEQIYRQRYLDLIMNKNSRNLFLQRSQIVQSVRQTMLDYDYLEVETPMMHIIPGGATAKPFITHHNALDMPLYLRIAPELYLKKLIVGGINRVFEINRNFRNEGISTRHNPEFTMIEFYEAYADYKKMMELVEIIIKNAAIALNKDLVIDYQGNSINLNDKFARLSIIEAINHYNPHYTLEQLKDVDFLIAELTKLTKQSPKINSLGVLQLALFEECTETKLIQPTFIVDYPVDTSPLARTSDTNNEITERFELFIAGRELANGYSELNDPEEQAYRFKRQVLQKDAGDEEAMHYDADYVKALEYGMPATGGCGIGIDRLVMLLTNVNNIRDVIFFPHMRIQNNTD